MINCWSSEDGWHAIFTTHIFLYLHYLVQLGLVVSSCYRSNALRNENPINLLEKRTSSRNPTGTHHPPLMTSTSSFFFPSSSNKDVFFPRQLPSNKL